MTTLRRTLPLLLVLSAVVALPGCGRLIRLVFATKPDIVLPAAIPNDFKFAVQVRNAKDPDIDYFVSINRDRDVEYRVDFRSLDLPERVGKTTVEEEALEQLWAGIREVRFHELDELYEQDGDYPTARNAGERRFYVRSAGLEKAVESKYVMPPEIRRLAILLIQTIPPDLLKPPKAEGPEDAAPATGYVGDMATKTFHRSDCVKCKEIADHNRQPFPTYYDALNFRYSPCQECKPTYAPK